MKNTINEGNLIEGDFKKGGINLSKPDPSKRPHPILLQTKSESLAACNKMEWENKLLIISNELFESLIATIEEQAETIGRLTKEK